MPSRPGRQSRSDWRPGLPALASEELEAALRAEALAGDDVADLVAGRVAATIAAGEAQHQCIEARGDRRRSAARDQIGDVVAGQRFGAQCRLELLRREARQTWPPVAQRLRRGHQQRLETRWREPQQQLRQIGIGADPVRVLRRAAATGEWFVALGTRAACLLPASTGDGTAEQAARLARWLAALALLSTDRPAATAHAGRGRWSRGSAATPRSRRTHR